LTTVTDLPAVIFEVPESISVAPGKVTRLQFLLRRYDGGKSPLKIDAVAPIDGITFEGQEAPPDKPNMELKVIAAGSFEPGRFQLRAGSSVSPPIELKVKTSQEDEQ
jgi:hypothetical protein